MLYKLSLYNVICQSYFNKTGKKEKWKMTHFLRKIILYNIMCQLYLNKTEKKEKKLTNFSGKNYPHRWGWILSFTWSNFLEYILAITQDKWLHFHRWIITQRWKATCSKPSKNKKGDDLIILLQVIFMRNVKRSIENQTPRHKLTNAFPASKFKVHMLNGYS